MQSRGPGGTLGKALPIISSFESLRQAQPLAGMWWRVTKELERGGLKSTCLPLPGGVWLKGAGAPTFPREPISSPQGLAVLVPYLPTREHAGSQSLSLNSERVLQATPTSLLRASSLCHPHSSRILGPQLSKSRLARGCGMSRPCHFPLYDLAPAPPGRSSGSPGGALGQRRLLRGSLLQPKLGTLRFLPPGPTHRCPPEARGCRAARRQSPGDGRWGLAPRCTGSHPL